MNENTKSCVTIAAYNSSESLKKCADIVCCGENDEITIQKIIDQCAQEKKDIYLLNGTYCIDGFYDFGDGGPRAALCFPNNWQEMSFVGQANPYGDESGVELYVTPRALDQIDGEGYDVIRTTWTKIGLANGSALSIQNIRINASHNQKPFRCIDLRRCDRPELKNIGLKAYKDMRAGFGTPPPVPVFGCIGLTMTDGSNDHYSNYTNVLATGFYEGIQVGGEHVVLMNCAAIMNYYGYTFGNYEINCGANHPITMINCMDERNVNLPLFNCCGDSDKQGNRMQGNQEVTMISFNLEYIAEQSPGKTHGHRMKEVHPGTWRGNIDFTAQPAWNHLNIVDFQLWENDGSGQGFKTRNNCHKLACNTQERLSYYPTYAQQVFDTDLNNMLICVDVENRKWVDFNGNEC